MTLTLPKLLILLVVGWLVWTFLRKQKIIGDSQTRGGPSQPPQNPKRENAVEDMVKCPKCGAYVPAKGGHTCSGA
jgi:hypothetical protein